MSFKKTKLKRKTADGADTIYIETSSALVMRDTGHSVETDLAAVETAVANKVGITGTVSNGTLAAFDGNGNVKAADVNMNDLADDIDNLNDHLTDSSNPHSVTAAQVGAYTKSEVNSAISTAKSEAIAGANTATGVTAKAYGPDAAQTPSYNQTFKVPGFTVNAAGKVTAAGDYNVTIPAAPTINFTSGLTATSAANGNQIDVAVSGIDASKLTGMVPLANIPKAAVSELKVVADETAMYALTFNDVQNGDVVKVNSTGVMYYVKDDSELGGATPENAFEEFKAGIATSVAWSDVTGKPETFAPSAHEHTWSEVTGKPNFAAVATSGSYSDLSGTPSIPTASNAAPAAPGSAAAGSSANYARADHVHPIGEATQFSENTTVSLTGDATGTSTGSKKGWSVPVILANSGVTAGDYGPSADETVDEDGSILVPQISVDAKGRITAIETKTYTLTPHQDPSIPEDKNVKQNLTNGNAIHKVLLTPSGQSATATGESYFAESFTYNPYTGNLSATKFNNHTIESDVPANAKFTDTTYDAATVAPKAAGTAAVGTSVKYAREDHVHPAQTTITGNAGTATKLADAVNIGLSGVTATAQSFDGSGNITIPITSVPASIVDGLATVATSGSYNDLSNKPSIPAASSTTPKAAGTAAVGTGTTYARADHVHPAQTSVSGNAGTATKLAASKSFSITGGATAAAVSFDGSSNVALNVTELDGSKITGTIPLAAIPAGARENMVTVANDTARFALTTDAVQLGDIVKVTATNLMYIVVDEANLSNNNGYEVFVAGYAGGVDWANVDNKPTIPTVPGYGSSSTTVTASDSASAGSATTIARSDHTHNLPASGVTAGSYGESAAKSPGLGGTFSIPYVTVDTYGRVTGASSVTITMPSHPTGGVEKTSGLYKITTNATGHVTAATAVAKSDITGLGIPAQDTTYDEFAGSEAGLVPTATSGDASKFLQGDGTWATISVPVTSVNNQTGDVSLTYSDVGAAAASHGTHVTYSTTAPAAAGTASAGSASTVARSDHVHPAQTSVSGNAGTATTLATARYIDGAYFNGNANVSHYATCATAAGTTAKVATISPTVSNAPSLVVGFRVMVKFTYANTVNSPTLNVNSTGAKTIYRRGKPLSANVIQAGDVCEFVYDGTYWQMVCDAGAQAEIVASSSPTVANQAVGDYWFETLS